MLTECLYMNTQHILYFCRGWYLILILPSLILFSACTRNSTGDSVQLENALKFAGNNRIELEKVLNFYSRTPSDSLKYKAACFLIKNMPNYYSYYSPDIDSVKNLYQAVAHQQMNEAQALRITREQYGNLSSPRQMMTVYDSHVITASYLIQNIEHAFKMWKKQPWGKYVKFNDFCEYILPYRIAYEPLEEWRDIYAKAVEQMLDSLYRGSDMLQAYRLINENIIQKQGWSFTLQTSTAGLNDLGALYLWKNRIGNCWNRTYFTTYLLRSVGIPCGIDYLKQAPRSAANHCWSFVADTTGLSCDFEGGDNRLPARDNFVTAYELKGKIYRKTFSAQQLRLKVISLDKDIPETLSDKYERDVSGEYFPNERITVRCENIPENTNIAYLCLFDNSIWIPVDWAKIKNDTAHFEHMDWRNIVYLVGYYKKGRIIPACAPILTKVMGKRTVPLKPNMKKRNKMRLERKFPESPTITFLRDILIGGRFQGANRSDFKDAVDMYTISQRPPGSYLTLKLDTVYHYRYVRFLAKDGIRSDMSELEFYAPSDSVAPLKGTPMGNPPEFGNMEHSMEKAFDGDPLTCYVSDYLKDAWIGLDLGEKKAINKIRFAPRSDDNSIREGDEYELKYLSQDGWVSMGKQIAKTYFLEYADVPDNALYLLSNLTRGREERSFTYENNNQVWW